MKRSKNAKIEIPAKVMKAPNPKPAMRPPQMHQATPKLTLKHPQNVAGPSHAGAILNPNADDAETGGEDEMAKVLKAKTTLGAETEGKMTKTERHMTRTDGE